MASRNGLNPKIRGLKGVGFGRPLLGAFGFENGVSLDGVDDFIEVIHYYGVTSFPVNMTVEYWVKPKVDSPVENTLLTCHVGDGGGSITKMLGLYNPAGNMQVCRNVTNIGGDYIADPFTYLANVKYHICIVIEGDNYRFYRNGALVGSSTMGHNAVAGAIGQFSLFRYNVGIFNRAVYDEVRFYNVALTVPQIANNYNGGAGANPCITEFLMLWYKFEQFEVLDFSALQDGSDMRTGVRDLSGKNAHGLPQNMDTNPASPTYVLKHF